MDHFCKYCGREMTERKSWKNSDSIPLYCSDACRKIKNKKLDENIEAAILLKAQDRATSFCPSEIARELFPEEETWRAQMERVRCAARRLFLSDKILILQKDKIIQDVSRFKGPIRLRSKR